MTGRGNYAASHIPPRVEIAMGVASITVLPGTRLPGTRVPGTQLAGAPRSTERKSSRSRTKYCATQRQPNVATLAPSTAKVRAAFPKPREVAVAAARLTASVDSPSPAKESAQKGPSSGRVSDGPPCSRPSAG